MMVLPDVKFDERKIISKNKEMLWMFGILDRKDKSACILCNERQN